MTGTPQTAFANIQNNTGGTAIITMSHMHEGQTVQTQTWTIASGAVSDSTLECPFETGADTGFDYWYCSASVMDGPNSGIYVTEGSAANPSKECELMTADIGQTFTNTVDTNTFAMKQPSGHCTTPMSRIGPYSPITNVFVLMLENRSFDHMFGLSGIPGINGLNGTESNSYDDNGTVTNYTVQTPATDPMTTDPNHEFLDTYQQLTGQPGSSYPGGAYPASGATINNSGFAANYATVDDEHTGLPASSAIGDVLNCCTPDQIPAMYQLATEFAICDNWFASIPGPTWPNRFFAMGASSSGLAESPSGQQIFTWETINGFRYVNGSLFDLCTKSNLQYAVFNDASDQFAENPAPIYDGGCFAIASALHGIGIADVKFFDTFATDLQNAYRYQFTWIEPNYGDTLGNSYSGGSSQHPMDVLSAGEQIIAATYNAIRNSPVWNTSMLIITYDEHGGFYDHVAPGPAAAPGDNPNYGYQNYGFEFNNYGIRVPAVVVSPLIAKGTVDHTVYDHSSIARTVEDLYSLGNLTARDAAANSLRALLTLDQARTDCPAEITAQAPPAGATASRAVSASDDLADPTPLPDKGNAIGFLGIAAKTDIELQGGTEAARAAVLARVQAIQTKGQARQYFQEVWAKLQAAKAGQVKS